MGCVTTIVQLTKSKFKTFLFKIQNCYKKRLDFSKKVEKLSFFEKACLYLDHCRSYLGLICSESTLLLLFTLYHIEEVHECDSNTNIITFPPSSYIKLIVRTFSFRCFAFTTLGNKQAHWIERVD